MIQPIDGYGILTGLLTFKGFKQLSKKEKAYWLLIYPVVLVIFLYTFVNNFFFGLTESRKEKRKKQIHSEKSDV